MTNPNTGAPVAMRIPELLEGADPLSAEIDSWDESMGATELLPIVRRLSTGLDRSAAYGRSLWRQLELVATYLREDIAHGAATEGMDAILLDERQRGRWAEVYSSTLSLLASSRGDSGYGREQAQLELQNFDG